MNYLNNFLLTYFPNLGKIKRFILAYLNSNTRLKSTYAQHGEDKLVLEYLNGYNKSNCIYVDVGSNHPTRISNTYLMYRNGFKGISIEPNSELSKLHAKFRPLDKQVEVGCGNKSRLELFNIYNIPVLSNFNSSGTRSSQFDNKLKIVKQLSLPILTLDQIIEPFNPLWISLLSIDVEGMDFEVLEGGEKTIMKTLLVLIEANNDSEAIRIKKWFQIRNFSLEKELSCNMLFRNRDENFVQYKLTSVNI